MKRWIKVAGTVAAIGVLTVGGVSYAAGGADATIHGCVDQNGNVRVIGANETCRNRETALNWNTTGPVGPVGPQGPAGQNGRDGTSAPVPNSIVIGTVRIDGIQGGDPAADTFDIVSYSQDAAQTESTVVGNSRSGKVSFSDFHFVKHVDTASPKLMLALAQGEHVRNATVAIYKPGTTTINETFAFEDVMVTGVKSHDEGAQNGVPLEDVAISYNKIKQTYAPTSGGDVTGGWDVVANRQL
jgi:type VI secretion system secreted protein Hcp